MQIDYTEGQPVIAQTSTYAGSKLYTVQLGRRNVCDLNAKDGTLSNCHLFMRPLFVDNLIINPQLTYSYHSNVLNGVTVCQLNQDGIPSHCKPATTKPSSLRRELLLMQVVSMSILAHLIRQVAVYRCVR